MQLAPRYLAQRTVGDARFDQAEYLGRGQHVLVAERRERRFEVRGFASRSSTSRRRGQRRAAPRQARLARTCECEG